MRLDKYLVLHDYFSSRTKAVDAIERGLIAVNGEKVDKSAKLVGDDDVITVLGSLEFVSRGAYKLNKLITAFSIGVSDMVFADIGASTGGFTDVLLRHGASRVYAVDVGENQLDKSIYTDKRVVVMDNTNARYLLKSDFPEPLDGITADCSFISLKLLLPVFSGLLTKGKILFALIKPQFECGTSNIGKNGILKDAKIREKVVLDVISAAACCGFTVNGIVKAPVYKEKNIEYMVYFSKCDQIFDSDKIIKMIREAV